MKSLNADEKHVASYEPFTNNDKNITIEKQYNDSKTGACTPAGRCLHFCSADSCTSAYKTLNLSSSLLF